MSKKSGIAVIVLCAAAVVLAAAALIVACLPCTKAAQGDTQYVLYLGTNDKDSNEPVFMPDEAKEKAQEILLAHFGGYTIQEANGGWIDGEKVYREYTLVIYLSDTDLKSVHAAADDLIRVFNQSSVLIQANQIATEFYSGNK
ncbi:MAG: hypothetical protein II117_08225 [Clostridia bacterium]|nr:hypothetical protein [Clostridia bacterium]